MTTECTPLDAAASDRLMSSRKMSHLGADALHALLLIPGRWKVIIGVREPRRTGAHAAQLCSVYVGIFWSRRKPLEGVHDLTQMDRDMLWSCSAFDLDVQQRSTSCLLHIDPLEFARQESSAINLWERYLHIGNWCAALLHPSLLAPTGL